VFKGYGGLEDLKGSAGEEVSNVQFKDVCDWLIGYDSYTVSSGEDSLEFGYRYGQFVDYPIVLPGDRNVEVKVTSADVIHC